MPAPLLVAPAPFKGTLRAPQVAAALGRGLEAGGWEVDLCPIADGGAGTLEVLLPALAGETGAVSVGGREVGIGLIEGGGTAVVELCSVVGGGSGAAGAAGSSSAAGELILAAAETGAEVILVGAGDVRFGDGGAGAVAAIAAAGGIAAKLDVLCDVRTAGAGRAWGGSGGGIAGALARDCGAQLEPGAAFVLEQLGVEQRMLAARAVIVGEGLLDLSTLSGKAPGELATRARQSGVPCFAVVGARTLEPFGGRILDLQAVLEAGDLDALEQAGRELARLA
ncbi:MAG TPA: glycerate kinase [Conexibacter sp.]|jgi:glycerate kinase